MVIVAYMMSPKNSAFTELGRLAEKSDCGDALFLFLATRSDVAGILEVVTSGSKAVASARYGDNGMERYDNLVEASLENDQLSSWIPSIYWSPYMATMVRPTDS